MTLTINGSRGPYNNTVPGGFGANTAYNVVALASEKPLAVADAVIEMSPQPHPNVANVDQLIADTIGYAHEEIRLYDQDNDLKLRKNEIADVFMGNKELADQYLKAYDVADANGKKDDAIDVKENAAAMLMTLNPTTLLTDTMRAFASVPNSKVYTPAQQQSIRQNAQFLDDTYPTTIKGYTTPQTRGVQHFYMVSFPTFVNETLRGLITGLDLAGRMNVLHPDNNK